MTAGLEFDEVNVKSNKTESSRIFRKAVFVKDINHCHKYNWLAQLLDHVCVML